MNREDIRVGDIYSFVGKGRHVVAQVVKCNPKNIKMRDSMGIQWTVHPPFLREATTAQVEQFRSGLSKPTAALGSLVKYTGLSNRGVLSEFNTFVVIAIRDSTYSIAPLGGAGNRYVRGIVSDDLEIINFNVEDNA